MKSEPMLTPRGKCLKTGQAQAGLNCSITQDSEPNSVLTELFQPPAQVHVQSKRTWNFNAVKGPFLRRPLGLTGKIDVHVI